MEFQNVLETRRSIRQYDESKNNEEEARKIVMQLVKAATFAPSWKNSQTARYHCVISKENIENFKKNCLPEFNAKNSEGALALIVSTFVKNRSGFERSGEPTNELGNGWGYYDLGLHNENLVLKAKDMGLGTLIMGIRDEKSIRKMLNIPDDEIIVSVISVGYPVSEPEMPKRKSVDDIVSIY